MNSLNLHPVFTATITDCYEDHISLTRPDREQLMSARTTIRAHIRRELSPRLRVAGVTEVDRIPVKFITQGSHAYGLLNAPAKPPGQQADLDDGAYIPLSFCENTGSPKAVSRLLIDTVEALLTELVRKISGWTIKTDNPNCTRVIIAPDKHVDVPVYSIPDDQFRLIAESRYLQTRRTASFSDYYLGSDDDDVWELMPERVRLAHKILGWLDSDPRPIKDWIDRQALLKSEQLRRLIRYLKAWRDEQSWPTGDPKSLVLMALVDAVLERRIDRRDDLALIEVCAAIPARLRDAVTIPPIPNEDLSKQLDKDGIRETLMMRVGNLHTALQACVSGRHTPHEVCRILQQHFGSRFPNRPDRILVDTPEAVVHAVAPRKIAPAPIVGRREAG